MDLSRTPSHTFFQSICASAGPATISAIPNLINWSARWCVVETILAYIVCKSSPENSRHVISVISVKNQRMFLKEELPLLKDADTKQFSVRERCQSQNLVLWCISGSGSGLRKALRAKVLTIVTLRMFDLLHMLTSFCETPLLNQ